MTFSPDLHFLSGEEILSQQITYVEELPPREASLARPSKAMHPLLAESLERKGLQDLYLHQALAYDAAMGGKDLVVVTGTNSGKTLCYNLPALQIALTEPASRCLYLFPTKALAQDQLGKLEGLTPGSIVRTGTYDGDTPPNQRGSVRKLSHIILTNPDMLHVGILPGHESWTKFLKSLRLIVLDEMHVYRGVFGSHVGSVIRRLLRLCEWHHSRPQIIGCSATIGNPVDLFEKLTGRTPELIDVDGSPSGKRTFIFWNPPMVSETDRLSANVATSEMLATLAEEGKRTLAFSRARVSAELVLRYARKRVESKQCVAATAIESYRAGYTPKERRQIESALFKGDLLGLSATNAMELGVDVGALDAVILNGYPGTASSFWQQCGRAGRGTRDGLAIFVAHDDPLEQFFVRDPRMLLEARNENVTANPENPQILAQQLLCAAHERPLAPQELERFGSKALELAEGLDRSGELQYRGGMFFYPSFDPPALRVNIRGAGGDQVRLMFDGNELGSMERWRAMTSAHEGAVYLHRGASYLVTSLDLDQSKAEVVPMEVPYYTQAVVQSIIQCQVDLRREELESISVSLVGINVTDVVQGFRKKALDGDTVISVEALEMPPVSYDTLAVRFDFPELDLERDMASQMGGIHGFEHALMSVAPLLAGCDRGDLGSAWYTAFQDTLKPAVFAFDTTPGGVGLCETLYDNRIRWVRSAHRLLDTCECTHGCPACLLSPRCSMNNETLEKQETLRSLSSMI